MKNRIEFKAGLDTQMWLLLPDLAFSVEKKQVAIALLFLCFYMSLTINKK